MRHFVGIAAVLAAGLVACQAGDGGAGSQDDVSENADVSSQAKTEAPVMPAKNATKVSTTMADMAPDGKVERTLVQDGRRYELVDGAVFDVTDGGREYVSQVYDPEYYAKNYAREGDVIYRVDANSGQRFPVWREFNESFDDIASVHDLIGPDRGWTGLTLLEPKAPTVGDSIKLRQRIIDRKSDFLDNRIEPASTHVRTGAQALRLHAVSPSKNMLVSKSSIDTAILHFVRGDDFWFSGWFYLEEGRPLGILDLESSFLEEGPGMRLLFTEEGEPRMELKWAEKPTYRSENPRRFEAGRWIKVRLHLYLSEKDDGRVRLWFDEDMVIDATGQTMPVSKAIYDRIQVGITANPKGSTATMYIDDLRISPNPL